MEEKVMRYWDFMVDEGIATNEEIGLAIALCGKNLYTMQSILFVRTGYRDLDQYIEDELNDPIDEDCGI